MWATHLSVVLIVLLGQYSTGVLSVEEITNIFGMSVHHLAKDIYIFVLYSRQGNILILHTHAHTSTHKVRNGCYRTFTTKWFSKDLIVQILLCFCDLSMWDVPDRLDRSKGNILVLHEQLIFSDVVCSSCRYFTALYSQVNVSAKFTFLMICITTTQHDA